MQQKEQARKLLKLFGVFFRIGAFTFGGGYAMVPLIQKEISEKHHWIEDADVADVFAVVQSVPGVIAVNSSIFIGYKVAGILGAAAAVLGVALPSFFIISVIALFFYGFREAPWVREAFEGIRAGVAALILYAVVKLGKPSVKGVWGWAVALLSFLLVGVLRINAMYVLLAAAVAGYFVRCLWNVPSGRKEGAAK